MSESSPADLAVAYRSFPRRLREGLRALEDDPSAAAARSHADAVTAAIDGAADRLGLAAARDPTSTAAAVADRIADTHPDRWDEGVLDALRAHALAAGRALRAIDDLAR